MIFSMMSILLIFGYIKKLRSLKLELVIKVTIYIIFEQSKNFKYRYIKILKFSVCQIYLSVSGVIVVKIAMIKIFKNNNWKIPTLLNFLQISFQPVIK